MIRKSWNIDWGLHVCYFHSECKKLNGKRLKRINIRTPWIFIMVGDKSQVYDRKTKTYTDKWAYLTFRPK